MPTPQGGDEAGSASIGKTGKWIQLLLQEGTVAAVGANKAPSWEEEADRKNQVPSSFSGPAGTLSQPPWELPDEEPGGNQKCGWENPSLNITKHIIEEWAPG